MKSGNKNSDKLSAAWKPRIGITMGDPTGIGPEIVVKSLADASLKRICTPVIIGDIETLRRASAVAGLKLEFKGVDLETESARLSDREILTVDLGNVASDIRIGRESPAAGAAAGQFIEKAVDLCKRGGLDAIATAPINKKAFNAGGFDFPGHTEFLAHLTNTKEFRMSFFAGHLRVVLLSIHVSLKDAIAQVTRENLVELIRFTDRELGALLGKKVKIAVAGLNPHASEHGMFGDEEAASMEPAVTECRDEFGIDVSGPFSPDTIFLRGFEGEFDAVIAEYHDQATIAVKCLSFGKGVNVTLGLPVIRTSVDHGTAFEIAGMNKAECGSMRAAITLAAELAAGRHKTARNANL